MTTCFLCVFSYATLCLAENPTTTTWTECGYADFADGQFGNGGQNIYVSAGGILQRVFQFDYNKDGYFDLLYVNAHDMNERAPVFVYNDLLGSQTCHRLVNQGAYTGALADLNGDGFDDLVIANQHNGTHAKVSAYIYYGAADGLSERYKVELYAPDSKSVAIGDFNGDGLQDIAFGCGEVLRIYYQQAGYHFSPGEKVDHPLIVPHLTAADIDDDGYDDLYARVKGQPPQVLWGGPQGIDPKKTMLIGGPDATADELPGSSPGWMHFARGWRTRIVLLNDQKHLYRAEKNKAYFYPVKGRSLSDPLIVDCEQTVAVAVGDMNRDGHDDLALAVDGGYVTPSKSWLYWGTDNGFHNSNRVAFSTQSARDVAIEDIDGDGHQDLVICQGRTNLTYDTHSLVFKGNATGPSANPVHITTHDATTVLIGKTSSSVRPDVIFINHSTGRVGGDVSSYIYWGGADGFKADRKSTLPSRSAADAQNCDFNDDGWTDILICNNSENAPELDPGSYIYWGGPNGFSIQRRQVLPTIRNWGSAVGDFRRCGYLDLVLTGFENPEVLVFRNGPQGFDHTNPQRMLMDPSLPKEYQPKPADVFASDHKRAYDRSLSNPRWLASADYNNDGWLDVFVSQCCGPTASLLWGSPEGFRWTNSQKFDIEDSVYSCAADLTGNGWLDLVVGGYDSPSKPYRYETYFYVYWGGPEGYQQTRRMQLPANASNSIAIADFNNDGNLDIFTGSYHAGNRRDCNSFLYWGSPGGHYSETNFTRLFTHSVSGCIAADFDENGFVDLAVANHRSYGNHVSNSQVWWNGAEGFSEQRTTELPTLGPHGMLVTPVGNILDRGNEEYYVSSARRISPDSKVHSIRWEADCPPKTWVRAQLRFAKTEKDLKHAAWTGPTASREYFQNGECFQQSAPQANWVQYRLALGAINGGCTPRVRKVTVEFQTTP